jgi:hypothetical protein
LVSCRFGCDFRTVQGLHRQIHKPDFNRGPDRMFQQAAHGGPVGLVKSPQGIVIWMLPSGQPKKGDVVPAGRLQLSARPNTGHETVKPDVEQDLWVIGRSTQWVPVGVDLHACPSVAVQSIHKGGNEPGRVILRKKVIEVWR